MAQCNKRLGNATTNQLKRGAGGDNSGATREGWGYRVAEEAVTSKEVVIQQLQTHGLGDIYRTILVHHNIQVPT